jgi:hypothetical protein
LDILNFFSYDRNSFIFEEREKLGLYNNAKLNLNEHQITSKYNVRLGTDSLVLITNISQENQKASIAAPINISVAIHSTQWQFRQEEIYAQTEVQMYERKNTMSRRVIDKTTLRIYVRQHLQTIYT